MARFKFSLQPLLRARQRAEQDTQRALAVVERERRELEDQLRRQQRNIAEGKVAQRGRLTGELDMADLRQQAIGTVQVMRSAQRLALELAGVHKRQEAARLKLIEAARHRRAIELLRDRRFEEWKKSLEKAETMALDELSAIAVTRKESQS